MQHKVYETMGEMIRIPIPQNYKDVFILIKSDYYRSKG